MVNLQVLKDHPDSHTIKKVLDELVSKSEQEVGIDDIMIVITKLVPVYPSIGSSNRGLLRKLISMSYRFMAQLVNFANNLSSDHRSELKIYRTVIIEVLNKEASCLYNYSISCSKCREKRNILVSLFFGSRIFNLLAEDVDIVTYLECMKLQVKCIMDTNYENEIKQSVLGEYFVSILSLNPIFSLDVLIGNLLFSNQLYYDQFKSILQNSSRLELKRLLNKYILPYLDLKTTRSNYPEIYKLLKNLPLHKSVDTPFLLSLKSIILQKIIIQILPQASTTIISLALLSKFEEIDEYIDENVCHLLCIILQTKADSKQKENMANSSSFLNAVTKRLGNRSLELRERTMFIAKLATDGTLDYESNFKIEIPNLDINTNTININIDFGLISDIYRDKTAISTATNALSNKFDQLVLESDSDDEDESEAGRQFVFIKDVVQQYEKIEKNKRNKIVDLLKVTIKLVRQKVDFSTEVSFFGPTLFTNVSCLNNDFDEANFEEWRINTLVSLLVVVPGTVKDSFKILFNSELSLQQRMSILSSLGLASRELRGLHDSYVVKPQFDFPTSRLPWDKPEYNNRIEKVADSGNKSLMKQHEVTWVSKKLEKKDGPKQNNFRKYANLFFYPLANAWLNGIDMGSYDQIFKVHYFSTLHIIYQCANPVHEYEAMTALFNQIVEEALEQGLPIEKFITNTRQ